MIDATVSGSPGWYLDRLLTRMQTRNQGLRRIRKYLEADAPLPEGASGMAEAYRSFQRKARANFAGLVVDAVQERMTVAGFRIGDETSLSREADRIWSYNELDTFSGDVHGDMLGLRDGYVVVGPPDADGIPCITQEDPDCVIVEPDPLRPTRCRAALKLVDDDDVQYAYLYVPGAVYVAKKQGHGAGIGGYEWVADRAPMRWPAGFEDVVPVIRFHNKGGVAEFERYTDTLDCINLTILQRLVITAMQAFRQRAIKGSDSIPQYEEDADGNPMLDADGEPIPLDVASVMKPGPGALWMLPDGAELWESQTTDFTPVLAAAKDDIKRLAAETRTPMYMLMPDSQNQSAEGAQSAREQLVYKAQDRIKRASYGWNQVMALALRFSGAAVNVLDIETLWLPPERLSLSERADAASKLTAAGVPWRTIMTDIMQFSPEKVEEMEAERLADAVAASLAVSNGGQ